jgi:hypothetical protein
MIKNYLLFSISASCIIFILSDLSYSYSTSTENVPYWHYNDAKWWSEEKISSEKFQKSLFILLDESNKQVHNGTSEYNIPDWFVNVAKWFSENRITSEEYIETINYLYSNDIIIISDSASQIALNEYTYEEYFMPNYFNEYINLFSAGFYHKDLLFLNEEKSKWRFIDIQFEFNLENLDRYESMISSSNVVVISPTFTFSAYSEPGFYTFYRGECDREFHGVLFRDEDCLTVPINYDKPVEFTASSLGINILHLLGYKFITDVDVDQNPEILKKYDKIIILHNEYVTKKMFDALTSHPKVIYLYPNALYAEVDVDYNKNTITLVKGHNYPEVTIRNGFNWEYDKSELEYNLGCVDWEFEKIPNGYMLNCYPTHAIYSDELLLQYLNEL